MTTKTIARILFTSITLVSAWALYDLTQIITALGVTLSLRWILILVNLSIILLSGLIVVTLHFTIGFRLPDPILYFADAPRFANPLIAFVCFFAAIFLSLAPVLHPYYGAVFFNHTGLRLFVFLISIVLCAQCLRLWTKRGWDQSYLFALILLASLYRVAASTALVTDYPFSLGWTETTRYYTASLIFSRAIYGEPIRWTFLLPTYSMILSLPFAIPGLPLWAHRLWLALLTVGLTAWTSFALIKRLGIKSRLEFWMLTLWGMLFIFQGPIYVYLLISVIIVLHGYSSAHTARTWLALLNASFWAGMSRITWFPVPAMLVIGLYLLETPYPSAKSFWEYIRRPLAWGLVSLPVAFLGQVFFVWISGNALASFYTGASSDLLWGRLLPNATFAPGVLLGSVIVSLPLWIVLGRAFTKRSDWHPVRIGGLVSGLAVLFMAGIVFSTKIGGGGDLHNLDAYLILLMIAGATLFVQAQARPHWSVIALAALVPIAFSVLAAAPIFTYDHASAQKTLGAIKSQAEQGGEVLFISERHLITFGIVNARLVPEYEKDELIERAMAGDFAYLEKFYIDLKAHRFAAIIADPQKVQLFDETYGWGKENNTWVRKVAVPLLCEYEPLIVFPEGIALYIPRAVRDCPEVK
jgi:hypothetical protein